MRGARHWFWDVYVETANDASLLMAAMRSYLRYPGQEHRRSAPRASEVANGRALSDTRSKMLADRRAHLSDNLRERFLITTSQCIKSLKQTLRASGCSCSSRALSPSLVLADVHTDGHNQAVSASGRPKRLFKANSGTIQLDDLAGLGSPPQRPAFTTIRMRRSCAAGVERRSFKPATPGHRPLHWRGDRNLRIRNAEEAGQSNLHPRLSVVRNRAR